MLGSDSTAAIGTSSRSGNLVSGACTSSKVLVNKVGTGDTPADVGTKYIEDGKKLTHLLGVNGVRMNRSVELVTLSAALVVLQGCASVVHVEGTVIGSRAAVPVRVSADIVITVATECLSLWLVARSRVGQVRTSKEINDAQTQCRLQQGTPHSNCDRWMLATCQWTSCVGIAETIGERNCSSVTVETQGQAAC